MIYSIKPVICFFKDDLRIIRKKTKKNNQILELQFSPKTFEILSKSLCGIYMGEIDRTISDYISGNIILGPWERLSNDLLGVVGEIFGVIIFLIENSNLDSFWYVNRIVKGYGKNNRSKMADFVIRNGNRDYILIECKCTTHTTGQIYRNKKFSICGYVNNLKNEAKKQLEETQNIYVECLDCDDPPYTRKLEGFKIPCDMIVASITYIPYGNLRNIGENILKSKFYHKICSRSCIDCVINESKEFILNYQFKNRPYLFKKLKPPKNKDDFYFWYHACIISLWGNFYSYFNKGLESMIKVLKESEKEIMDSYYTFLYPLIHNGLLVGLYVNHDIINEIIKQISRDDLKKFYKEVRKLTRLQKEPHIEEIKGKDINKLVKSIMSTGEFQRFLIKDGIVDFEVNISPRRPTKQIYIMPQISPKIAKEYEFNITKLTLPKFIKLISLISDKEEEELKNQIQKLYIKTIKHDLSINEKLPYKKLFIGLYYDNLCKNTLYDIKGWIFNDGRGLIEYNKKFH